MAVIREDWLKPFTIRDYHLQIYTELKNQEKIRKQQENQKR